MANFSSRVLLLIVVFVVMVLVSVFCFYFFVSRQIMRPLQSDVRAQTVSQAFQARQKGDAATLMMGNIGRGTYEVGFEFPLQKLPRGKSFNGLLRVEIFENGKKVSARDVTGKKRGYFEDADSYRSIALADFELPIGENAKDVKLVVSVLRVDPVFDQYQGIRLFVRPTPVK